MSNIHKGVLSGAKRSMDRRSLVLDPVSINKTLKNQPYKRIKFITVRDNKQKLVKVGACYDYLKRFSERIWLVKSPKNGTHFHALILLKENKKITYKKGIHVNIRDVGDPKPVWDPEFMSDKIEEATELAREAYDYTGDLDHASEVYEQVMKPPSKEYQKTLRRLYASKKEAHITRITEYLMKNLNENPLPHQLYEHYLIWPRQECRGGRPAPTREQRVDRVAIGDEAPGGGGAT